MYAVIADTAPDVAARLRNKEFTDANILELNIFYEDLNQQQSRRNQNPTLEHVINDWWLDGAYVGVSIITVVELVELVGSLFKYACKK